MHPLLATALVATSLVVPGLLAPSSTAAVDPTHSVSVGGTDGQRVSTYPTYSPTIDRFGVRSGTSVDTVSIRAASSDPAATVRVNGVPVGNGVLTEVTDLEPGEEVNVQITDAGGTSNQSWIVLPPGFPEVSATGPRADLAEGHVFLTLASFLGGKYTALVDAHGVPARAVAENASDFKRSTVGAGGYSIASPDEAGGYAIRQLDDQFREVRRFRLAGLLAASTDFHDAELLADGGVALMGYDVATRDGTTWTDAVLQVQDGAGTPTFTWNSKDHVEETEGLVDRSADDYAHVNSLQRLPNGDMIASFRNLSQVMLIAGSAHGGHQQGDVIWRLGGLRNDFRFIDDPYSGPCAQHAATILPNGRLLIFDNGGRRDSSGFIAAQTADMCPTPGDPAGPRVARPQSRVTEYQLDTSTVPPTARLVWSHEPQGRYAPFAGNAQRLPGGNTFVGWSQSEVPSGTTPPVATEVAPDGTELWSLSAPGYFSYRAFKDDAPDRTAPEITLTSPASGTMVSQGAPLPVAFQCQDAGGSNLDECRSSSSAPGGLTATQGTHTLTVTADDRAGNTTTRSVTYTVVAASSPPVAPTPTSPPAGPTAADVSIRKPGGAWVGSGDTGLSGQTVRLRTTSPGRAVAHVRLRNVGGTGGRLVLDGSGDDRWSTIRWIAGKRDVTRRVSAGTYRTSALASGGTVRLRLVVRVVRDDAPRHARTVRLTAGNPAGGGEDVVRARVHVR